LASPRADRNIGRRGWRLLGQAGAEQWPSLEGRTTPVREHGQQAELGGSLRPDELLQTRGSSRHDQRPFVERQISQEVLLTAHSDHAGGTSHQGLSRVLKVIARLVLSREARLRKAERCLGQQLNGPHEQTGTPMARSCSYADNTRSITLPSPPPPGVTKRKSLPIMSWIQAQPGVQPRCAEGNLCSHTPGAALGTESPASGSQILGSPYTQISS